MVNFDCLEEGFEDRYEFMDCLQRINQEYKDTGYVDVDDICRFLKLIKGQLFDMIEDLNNQGDTVGIKSVLEDIFSIILTIHYRTKDKVDLLQEFNTIHEILDTYELGMSLKPKLNMLKDVMDQCSIYYSRTVDEVVKAKEKRQEDRIKPEDYSFLKE